MDEARIWIWSVNWREELRAFGRYAASLGWANPFPVPPRGKE